MKDYTRTRDGRKKQAHIVRLPADHCIQVCMDDRLVGYAIKLSAEWDAWNVEWGIRPTMRLCAQNVDEQAAIRAVCSAVGIEPPAAPFFPGSDA